MDEQEFCNFGKAALDYIVDYRKTIKDRPVLPSVKPGYLFELLPNEAPVKSESWQDVMKDVDRCIMPGVSLISISINIKSR